ncbi:D-2-hydroxyacid dehydrogenase [Ruminococcus sp. OA3]|uniref:D-2-hydroxyacid dehydrogenase n=1 Tax=Ruminococcus sp. OA3 TaxID=2914164 RepID=UPI001F0532A5|nr:D-2-hydroxyacid dehydrogenase [Ruminococcus sp. OA3]MCH1983046.1 D-2-hydroxyacid dehydrogenase [Ruminococcus sp. OA3]
MSNIVILDGHTINPGDLSWEVIQRLGECTVYQRTPADLVLERCRDARIVLTSKVLFTRRIIESLPKLKYIGVLATGYNVVDVDAAREHGITVTNIPAYSTLSVAQMVFALLLQLCCHVKEHSDSVKEGKWSDCKDFCYWNYPMIELAGKTMGIIGFGMIGQQTARVANALGMRVTVFGRRKKRVEGIEFLWADSLEELLGCSDVVSLHCPLSEETKYMMNADTLQLMKPSAFLINTARGPLMEEHALAEALNSGRIAGAALDVLTTEPPQADNPLFHAKNCIITPHIAWATKEARTRLIDTAGHNLKAFMEGDPVNMVQ